MKFKLNINGHKDIDFIDIDERLDTRLFLDPYVIQALPDNFSTEACKSIDSFFCEVFKACRKNDTDRLRSILEYASEPNETNLGMKSISDYGKGASAAELTKLFLKFYKIVRRNPYLETNPLALCMYIRNFDKDKMSDLITNIIRNLLYDFTVEQSIIWNIPLEKYETSIGHYWDIDQLRWIELYGKPLSVGHKNILLVPKFIVRTRYVFNVECYIKQYILRVVQKEHSDKNTDMCSIKEYVNGKRVIIPPTIKELYRRQVHGTNHKDFAFSCSSENKNNEDNFVKDILRRINCGYGLISDEDLDTIVYKNHSRSVS